MTFNPSFGPTGLVTLTLDQINSNMEEYVHGSGDLGPDVSMGDHTIAGMVAKGAAVELEQIYRLIDDVWAGIQADAAEGVPQDNVNRLRGAVRNPARFSTCPVVLTGTPATSIAAGKIVAIPNGGERWIIDATVVIGGGGTVAAQVTAENSGAIEAAGGAPGAISEIVTAVTGWTGVNNTVDATLGEAVESDADYRNRSENTGTGTTTEEAIFTRLSELDDVDAVSVVSNRMDDPVDADGTPIHYIWIVIYPNTANQQDIAETIWGEAGAAGGIGFRGAVTATVTDDNGFEQQIRWDWATAEDLWVSIVGTKNADTYPIDGDQLIEDAVTAYFTTVRVGADVDPAPVEGAITAGENSVPGIKTIEARLKIGGAPGPGDIIPIPIAINEYADLNATIGVTMT